MLSPVWNTLKLSKGISWDMYNEEASLFWGEEKPGGNVDGKDMWCAVTILHLPFLCSPRGFMKSRISVGYRRQCCLKFTPHHRPICLDSHSNPHKRREWSLLSLTNPATYFETRSTPLFLLQMLTMFLHFFFFKYTLQETKDLETASIVSSTVDSSRGKLALEQNGPSLNLSNQQTQVEVKTWRCVLSVIV